VTIILALLLLLQFTDHYLVNLGQVILHSLLFLMIIFVE